MNSLSFISENETCMVVLNIALGHNTQMNQTLLIWGLWGGVCVRVCAYGWKGNKKCQTSPIDDLAFF